MPCPKKYDGGCQARDRVCAGPLAKKMLAILERDYCNHPNYETLCPENLDDEPRQGRTLDVTLWNGIKQTQ